MLLFSFLKKIFLIFRIIFGQGYFEYYLFISRYSIVVKLTTLVCFPPFPLKEKVEPKVQGDPMRDSLYFRRLRRRIALCDSF